jgi:hypothetical protein
MANPRVRPKKVYVSMASLSDAIVVRHVLFYQPRHGLSP